jgi:anaphase-promoting complex subunit 4
LVSTYTGKLINQIDSTTFPEASVCCLGWGVSFTDPIAARLLLESNRLPPGAGVAARKAIQRGGLLDEALAKGLRALDIEIPLDLPADLRNLDVEVSLPKLSVLPSSGAGDDVFSTRASIDTIFHTTKKDSNEFADIILIGFDDGTVHLSIYDFFELGTLQNLATEYSGHVVLHRSNPYSSTHSLLLKGIAASKSLSFVPMDLKLIHDHGKHLSLLASKAGQIQNLVRYMKATVAQISADFKSSKDLPKRFMRNAEEDLQEKEETSFLSSIYHFAATGNCSPILKEWLVDQIGDRGHKRWEKAAASGYEGVCRYTLQNLIPALDRFMILVSGLRGIARFVESSAALGLTVPALDQALDTADCMKYLAHLIARTASEELCGFEAFSNWMKLEIEVQNTDPTSAAADDFPARYSTLDYTTLFEYVQGAMQQSQLVDLCSETSEAADPATTPIYEEGGVIYEDLKKRLKSGVKAKPRPPLAAMLSRLDRQCQSIFSDIAKALRRKVRFGTPVPIHDGDIKIYDGIVNVSARSREIKMYRGTIAFSPQNRPLIGLKQINLKIVNGMSDVDSIHAAHIKFASDRIVHDLRFVDEKTLVVATTSSRGDASWLAYVPFRDEAQDENGLTYSQVSSAESSSDLGPELDLSDESRLEPYITHVFDEKPPWSPAQVEANGRSGRRALCIVASDRLRYRVFDLDNELDVSQALDEADKMEIESE